MNSLTEALVTIVAGITGVAFLAVLVSKNANTAALIQNAASGYGNALNVALSPVNGNAAAPNLSYSGGSSMGFYGQ